MPSDQTESAQREAECLELHGWVATGYYRISRRIFRIGGPRHYFWSAKRSGLIPVRGVQRRILLAKADKSFHDLKQVLRERNEASGEAHGKIARRGPTWKG